VFRPGSVNVGTVDKVEMKLFFRVYRVSPVNVIPPCLSTHIYNLGGKNICIFEERKGIGWWKMGVWRVKGMRGNIDKGVCPVCKKEEGGSHILQCEGTRVWRDRWLVRKFTSVHPEMGIKKIASNKMRDNWTKMYNI
jgi:hypothetical protein